MGLSCGQFKGDRQTLCIGDSVDFRRQAAPRTIRADGAKVSHTGGFGWIGAPFCVGSVLRDPDRGTVLRPLRPFVSVLYSGECLIRPTSQTTQLHEWIAIGRTGTVSRGDIDPWRPRPKPPVNTVEHPATIDARLVRQKQLEDGALEIGQFVTTSRYAAHLFCKSESAILKNRQCFMNA